MEDTAVKRTFVICLALVVLASITALAQNNTITINGGSSTVYMGAVKGGQRAHGAACVGFYDNICGSGYQEGLGWTISDGSPVNTEYSPASQFTSLKTGTTKKITVGVGYVEGTNTTLVELVKDCSTKSEAKPCTNPDGKPKSDVLCRGTIKNMPTFGSTGTTTVSIKCAASLTKGTNYWVLMQSPANSWLAWNEANSTVGNVDIGVNDTWTYFYTTYDLGSLTVK